MANSLDLEVVITAKDEASAKLKDLQKTATNLGKGFAVVGGALAGALGYAVKSASDAQVQMAKVDATLTSMGNAGAKARESILRLGDSALKLGFDNEEASLSMATLFQRTGDLEEAWEMQQIAMDLARAKSISLTEASKAVGMVMSGNGKILKQYGIDVESITDPFEQLQALQDKVQGQSKAFASTFAGASEILKQQVGELTEKVGGVLLPILVQIAEKVTPFIEKIIAWTDANPALTQTIVIATGAFAGLLLVLAPLSLLIGAISLPAIAFAVALGAIAYAVFQVVQNFDEWKKALEPTIEKVKLIASLIQEFMKPAVDFLIVALKLLWAELKALWSVIGDEVLVVLKYLGIFLGSTLVGVITIAIGAIGLIVFAVAGFAKGVQLLIEKLGGLFYWFQTKVPEGLNALKTAWFSTWDSIKANVTAVTDYITKKIQKVMDLWNSAKNITSEVGGKVSDAGSKVKNVVSSAISSLTGKAGGGTVTAGQSYVVGEKGQEVFTPSTSGSIIPNNKMGGGGNITVNINGGTYLSEDVAKQIGDKIISQFRRTVRI